MMEYIGKLIVTGNILYLMLILSAFTIVWELGHSLIFLLRCIPILNAIKSLKKYQITQKYQALEPSINWITKHLAGIQQGKNYIVKIFDNRFVLLDYPPVLEVEASQSKIKRLRVVCIVTGWFIFLYEIAFIITKVYERFYSQVGKIPKNEVLLKFLFSLIVASVTKIIPCILLCVAGYFLLTLFFRIAEFLRNRLRLVFSKRLDSIVIIQLRSKI